MHTEIKGYASGLAWGNTKSMLVLTRLWALPTLGQVFKLLQLVHLSLLSHDPVHHVLSYGIYTQDTIECKRVKKPTMQSLAE